MINKYKSISESFYLTTVFRIIVGIIFLYASLDKILYPAYFSVVIQNYQLIPDILTNFVAITLPWLEFFCGILLLIGFWQRAGATIISIMTFIFIIALLSVVLRGLDIDCGCYGAGTTASWSRIIEDTFLLAFSLHIVIFPASKYALENLENKNNRKKD